MSIVADILFVVAGLLTVLICVKRGFFLTLLRFLKLFLAFGAAYLWGGAFGSFLGEKFLNTPIRNWVFGRVNEIYQNTAGGFDVQSALGAVPDFLLTDSLRSMESDGLITRTVYPEVPPRVEYALSGLGESMRPIIAVMEQWGRAYKEGRL